MCVRDLDLWPRRPALQSPTDTIGFKEVLPKKPNGKGGNEARWIDCYTPDTLKDFKDSRRKLRGQNVEVELSDEWTLEYCLASGTLSELVYEALNESTDDIDTLPKDQEERAIYLYGWIESQSQKTNVAYSLVSLLKRRFTAVRLPATPGEDEAATSAREQEFQIKTAQLHKELRGKLPQYIVRAIDYVTDSAEAPMGPPPAEEVQNADVVQSNQ
jgi:putative ATP-dependent endonuclease of the OLD family